MPVSSRGNEVSGSVLGEVEPVDTMSTEGMLKVPKAALRNGFKWLSPDHVEEVKPSVKSFFGTGTVLGLADLKLESSEEWRALTA